MLDANFIKFVNNDLYIKKKSANVQYITYKIYIRF